MESRNLRNQPVPDGDDSLESFLAKKAEKRQEEAPAKTERVETRDADKSEDAEDLPRDLREVTTELKDIEDHLALLRLSPQERYLKILEREKIPLDEARRIIDRIVVQLKPYREDFPLGPETTICFQTCTVLDEDHINQQIEKVEPKFQTTHSSVVWKHNLARSIVRYGEQVFIEDAFEDRLTWVNKLSRPVYQLLIVKLQAFERKVAMVFQEGYLENF